MVTVYAASAVQAEQGKSSEKTTQKILELLEKNPAISRAELAVQIGLTPDGIKYHLDNLRKKGVLKRIGPDKGGYWEIVGK